MQGKTKNATGRLARTSLFAIGKWSRLDQGLITILPPFQSGA
jgi:hypothetical protein